MIPIRLHAAVLLFGVALATVSIRRAGWLDRVVQYHKNRFYKDVDKYSPIQINATILAAPPGYVDSKDWTYDSVIRLLSLIRVSENALPVRRALRRMLKPSRRIMMSMQESMKRFPSMSQHINNELYYDQSYYMDADNPPPPAVSEEEAVLIVSNPVEARLPSARISVKLLREILEARAKAARAMPPTTTTPIPWKPMNKTKSPHGGKTDPVDGGEGSGDDDGEGGGKDKDGADEDGKQPDEGGQEKGDQEEGGQEKEGDQEEEGGGNQEEGGQQEEGGSQEKEGGQEEEGGQGEEGGNQGEKGGQQEEE